MTVELFRKTMLQIDGVRWLNSDTMEEVLYPSPQAAVVDAYFHAENNRVFCSVYIKES